MNISKWSISEFGWHDITGVYAVCSMRYNRVKVHYIGSSKDIGKRLGNVNHPYRVIYGKFNLVHIRYIETQDYKNVEKEMIAKFKPRLNIHHNGRR